MQDYRIICWIEDSALTILVVAVGHRSTVYDEWRKCRKPFRWRLHGALIAGALSAMGEL
jgi:hypothetical protein